MTDTEVHGADPFLGTTVAGRYTVLRRIARGGMGVVYQAVQEPLGRVVALKIIRREFAADVLVQKRFEREARAVSQLAHPAIVTVYDFGRTPDGQLYLAMEFVDGELLRAALKRKQRFTVEETLPIVRAVCHALSRAHSGGVVHRDLKPENIILPHRKPHDSGELPAAKVLDFGLAKPHDPDAQGENLTVNGGFVGTPGYAAPEQVDGEPEDPRQDIYALGVLWWELLVGEHPFAAPTPMKMLARQMSELPARADARRTDLPPPVADVLLRMMAKDKNDRLVDARAVLAAVDALAHAPALPASASSANGASAYSPSSLLPHGALPPQATVPVAGPVSTPVPASAPASRPPTRGRLVVGGLVALGLVGAAVVALRSQRDDAAATDAGVAVLTVDAGPVQRAQRVVLRGVPTFAALRAIQHELSGAALERYTKEESVLLIADDSAARLAESLQGQRLLGEVPLVLEVEALDAHGVTARAVAPADASAIRGPDGGLVDQAADAGDVATDAGLPNGVLAPGGLSP